MTPAHAKLDGPRAHLQDRGERLQQQAHRLHALRDPASCEQIQPEGGERETRRAAGKHNPPRPRRPGQAGRPGFQPEPEQVSGVGVPLPRLM